MSQIVSSNSQILAALDLVRGQLNGSAGLRLWQNEISPTPATPLDYFEEASFPGYTRKNLAGTWSAPIKTLDGVYETRSGPHSWTPTADGLPVLGWLVTLDGVLRLSCRLNIPIFISAGVPFFLTVALQSVSLSVL